MVSSWGNWCFLRGKTGDFSLSPNPYSEERSCEHTGKDSIIKPGKMSLIGTKLSGTLILHFQSPEVQEIDVYCLNHTVYDILL